MWLESKASRHAEHKASRGALLARRAQLKAKQNLISKRAKPATTTEGAKNNTCFIECPDNHFAICKSVSSIDARAAEPLLSLCFLEALCL